MHALIFVDLQNDFLPGGPLAVPRGDEIIGFINTVQPRFDLVVATQDWHPPEHVSLISNHPERAPFEGIEHRGKDQILWPDHCVQGSAGASFASRLNIEPIRKVIQKGDNPQVDSYSGFYDNHHERATGLHDYLQQQAVDEVTVVGLATEVCVLFTVLDSLELGYKTHLPKEGTRALNQQPGDDEKALQKMREAGAIVE
ncbi:MAG: bifunctional nicotinamidase/pyrazinamidase [Opitutales bacterium]